MTNMPMFIVSSGRADLKLEGDHVRCGYDKDKQTIHRDLPVFAQYSEIAPRVDAQEGTIVDPTGVDSKCRYRTGIDFVPASMYMRLIAPEITHDGGHQLIIDQRV